MFMFAYSADRGDRADKPNIALLFTDGNSNDQEATLNAAREARVAGIKLVVIAVTNWNNMVGTGTSDALLNAIDDEGLGKGREREGGRAWGKGGGEEGGS